MVVGVLLPFLVGHAARRDVRLDADDRLDPGRLRRRVERDDPVHAPVVGQRERRHPVVGDAARHLRDTGQAVEEAELGVDVEVDEVAAGARVRGPLGHPGDVARMQVPRLRDRGCVARVVRCADDIPAVGRSDRRMPADQETRVRKVVLYTLMSLDGAVDRPDQYFPADPGRTARWPSTRSWSRTRTA